MRYLVTFLFLCTASTFNFAHPSWGIAVTDEGEIYFADVLHNSGTLWKINTEGQLVKVLTDFHAHDLHLDKKGNIWLAENLWIEGKIEGEGKHTLIKINQDESLDTLITTFDRDLFSGTNFAIGSNGTIYFENNNYIYRYNAEQPELLIDHEFGRVKCIWMDTDDNLWIGDNLTNNGTLYKYTPKGQLITYSTELLPHPPEQPLFKEKHLQFITGISKDENNNVYVSENAGCRIIKVAPDGKKSTFYQAPVFWTPLNVAFYKDKAYILEIGYNKKHKGPRIIEKDESGAIQQVVNVENAPKETIRNAEEDNSFTIPIWAFFALGLLIFSLVIIFSVKRQYKNT